MARDVASLVAIPFRPFKALLNASIAPVSERSLAALVASNKPEASLLVVVICDAIPAAPLALAVIAISSAVPAVSTASTIEAA